MDAVPAGGQSQPPTPVTRVSGEGRTVAVEWAGSPLWVMSQADGSGGVLLLAFHVKPGPGEQMEGRALPDSLGGRGPLSYEESKEQFSY